MTPEFESCSLLLLYWGMLFPFSLRLLSKSELAVGTRRGGFAASTVRHQQYFTRHVSRVSHVVDVVEAIAGKEAIELGHIEIQVKILLQNGPA